MWTGGRISLAIGTFFQIRILANIQKLSQKKFLDQIKSTNQKPCFFQYFENRNLFITKFMRQNSDGSFPVTP